MAYLIILFVVLIVTGIIAWLLTRIDFGYPAGLGQPPGWSRYRTLDSRYLYVGAILAVWAKYGGSSIVSHSWLAKLLVDKFPMVLALLPSQFDSLRSFFK